MAAGKEERNRAPGETSIKKTHRDFYPLGDVETESLKSFVNLKIGSVDMEFPYLKHPFSFLICGPSNSGKTYFVKRILESGIIEPKPPKVIWCYGVYQKLFDEMSNVEFVEGLPSNIRDLTDSIVVIDDLMSELGNDKTLANLFTRQSHHKNLSVIFIVQNMFHKGKEMRTISLNSSYMCCFKNIRDKMQIACLAKQMYPSNSRFFMESFKDATTAPYGYLFIDLKSDTDERMRLRTGIFPDDKHVAYVPR